MNRRIIAMILVAVLIISAVMSVAMAVGCGGNGGQATSGSSTPVQEPTTPDTSLTGDQPSESTPISTLSSTPVSDDPETPFETPKQSSNVESAKPESSSVVSESVSSSESGSSLLGDESFSEMLPESTPAVIEPETPLETPSETHPESVPAATEPESSPETTARPQYLTYKEYLALSGAEKREYFNSFPSVEAFFEWQNKAESEYEAEQSRIEIGSDGSIDIGGIIGGGN